MDACRHADPAQPKRLSSRTCRLMGAASTAGGCTPPSTSTARRTGRHTDRSRRRSPRRSPTRTSGSSPAPSTNEERIAQPRPSRPSHRAAGRGRCPRRWSSPSSWCRPRAAVRAPGHGVGRLRQAAVGVDVPATPKRDDVVDALGRPASRPSAPRRSRPEEVPSWRRTRPPGRHRRYEGTISEQVVQAHLDDAERILLRRADMADLADRITAGDVDPPTWSTRSRRP